MLPDFGRPTSFSFLTTGALNPVAPISTKNVARGILSYDNTARFSPRATKILLCIDSWSSVFARDRITPNSVFPRLFSGGLQLPLVCTRAQGSLLLLSSKSEVSL